MSIFTRLVGFGYVFLSTSASFYVLSHGKRLSLSPCCPASLANQLCAFLWVQNVGLTHLGPRDLTASNQLVASYGAVCAYVSSHPLNRTTIAGPLNSSTYTIRLHIFPLKPAVRTLRLHAYIHTYARWLERAPHHQPNHKPESPPLEVDLAPSPLSPPPFSPGGSHIKLISTPEVQRRLLIL